MSYILDALKKAAEQRSGPSLEVRRLLMPAPVPAVSRARYVRIGAIAAGVVAIGVALWIWAPAHDVSAPETPPVASVTPTPPTGGAPAPTTAPAAPTTAPAAPTTALAVPTAPPPAATTTPPAATAAPAAQTTTAHATVPDERPRGATERKPRVPLVPAESRTDTARTTSADTRTPATTGRPVETKPTRSASPAAPAPPGPVVSLLPPTGAPTPATRTDTGKLKVEVIVYSEDRPLRWAFISGRRYVEGDAIGDGARVEEIQSNGVVIVEDGRRITLRP